VVDHCWRIDVADVLRLGDRPGEAVSCEELKQQARLWSRRSPSRTGSGAQRAHTLFLRYGTQWLRHLGRLQPAPTAADPFAEVIAAFADYLRREKELAPENIYNHSLTIRAFLDQLGSAGVTLRQVTLSQIDDAFLTLITAKGYKRTSVQRHAEVDLEMKAKALATCEVKELGSEKPWREDEGLMEFLRSL
jgi:hypothetical protein